LVEQDFPFEKAAIFARAAVAHEEALERAPKWSGDQASDQFALRPLPMPASMALPTESSAADSPKRSGKPSFWKKLRAKTERKVEPESGLHLQLFSTLVPADKLPGMQEQQVAIVAIDLLEVSPLIAKYDAGTICCKIRTIDTRTQNAAVDPVPAVALSAFGSTLALKRTEALLVIEDVDSQNLELRVCTSESEDAAELCRVWMPAANLVSSSVEGHVVDVWLPAMPPPPQLDGKWHQLLVCSVAAGECFGDHHTAHSTQHTAQMRTHSTHEDTHGSAQHTEASTLEQERTHVHSEFEHGDAETQG
jgi:hypothetical protein